MVGREKPPHIPGNLRTTTLLFLPNPAAALAGLATRLLEAMDIGINATASIFLLPVATMEEHLYNYFEFV